MGLNDDLSPAEIRNLQWLLSSPKVRQIVIGEDGHPAMIIVPDPRAFAAHKIWLSTQYDRNPLKKNRDKVQALTIFQLVSGFLPQYVFNPSELRMFPKQIIDEMLDQFQREIN